MLPLEKRTISDIANITGLSEHTLRYYERIGLMVPVDRTSSGHRVYDDHAIEWVKLLSHLRETGMSIQEMQRFADLVKAGSGTEPQRLLLLEEHLNKLEGQISRLLEARVMVLHKVEVYRAGQAETPVRKGNENP